jgi:arylsulfatase A-like enzyme
MTTAPLRGLALAGLALLACRTAEVPDPTPTPTPEPAPAPVNLDCERCNVLVLNVGNLRADRYGLLRLYGEEASRTMTPSIDHFFGPSVAFEQASTPAGVTYYAAMAIATGTEAIINTHELREDDALSVPGLDPNKVELWLDGGGRWLVLAALEREGKLLVDHLPTIAQTLSSAGYHTAAVNDWIHTGEFVGLDRGFDHYIDLTDTSQVGAQTLTSTIPIDMQVELVIEQLSSHRDTHPSQPLYVYFHPNLLHFPYPDPDEPGQVVGRRAGVRVFSQAYDAQVRKLDEALGRLFSELQRGGWLRNTIVLIYANHGIELGDNDFVGMGRSTQGCVHTPMLMRHPKLQEPRRVDTPVSLVDLAPTLYDMLKIADPPLTSGHSLTPLLSGQGSYGRTLVVGRDLQEEYVRRGDWKLLVDGTGEGGLYNLAEDPTEQHDLKTAEPAIAAELALALQRERLRQLGFADDLQAALDREATP